MPFVCSEQYGLTKEAFSLLRRTMRNSGNLEEVVGLLMEGRVSTVNGCRTLLPHMQVHSPWAWPYMRSKGAL